PRPNNPAELLTAPRFEELLQEIRGKFDFIVIDTPPVLVVTDPCVVAPRVDGVLLTLRLTRNVRPSAERARDVFASLGANVLGVVVNGVAAGRDASGYTTYQYGYKYEYTSNYSYSGDYADDAAKNYYQEAEAHDGSRGSNGIAASGPMVHRRAKGRLRPFWKRWFD